MALPLKNPSEGRCPAMHNKTVMLILRKQFQYFETRTSVGGTNNCRILWRTLVGGRALITRSEVCDKICRGGNLPPVMLIFGDCFLTGGGRVEPTLVVV